MGPIAIYRLSSRVHRAGFTGLARLLKAFNFFLFHAVIPPEIAVGDGLVLGHHGLGVVINGQTTIGDNVYIHHRVTLAAGVAAGDDRRQVIGNGVSIGANAVVLGPVSIGDDVAIGAGAVVTSDLPTGAVAVGVPARIVGYDGATKHPDAC